MRLFKSIKWRLQLWYGLILVVVLAGFGFTAYQLEWGRQMRRIDEELQRRMGMIANALHPRGPRGPGFARGPLRSPPPDQFLGASPPRRDWRPPVRFYLPPQAAGLFGSNTLNSFYFVIFRRGTEFSSTNLPNKTLTQSLRNSLPPANAPSQFPEKGAKPPPPQTIGTYRNICRPLPSGDVVWVGCSIAPEVKELNLTALKLAGAGGIILLLGLVGGWWLVGRAIRPIDNISMTAAKISSGDLSQRIDVAETESELGRLAAVLNSTFARLETAFAQQQQFTSDAAHELRTPVSVILTQTQTTLNRERGASEYRETIEACQRSAHRMRRLIESLLGLARLDAGQEPMKRMSFDLSQIAGECVDSIQPLAEERGIKIHRELPPVKCTGDPERLAQVFTNLLTNAVQYNRENGEMRITAQLQNNLAIVSVTDTGPGIPDTDLPHVFERFYRADKSRSTSHSGLGLAIAKAVVEAHGGTMEVSSKKDTGTTFTIRLPA